MLLAAVALASAAAIFEVVLATIVGLFINRAIDRALEKRRAR